MNTFPTHVAPYQQPTAWLLTSPSTMAAANDEEINKPAVSTQTPQYTDHAQRQATRLGLTPEVAGAIFANGSATYNAYQTRSHYVSRQQSAAMRRVFGAAWRDAFDDIVLIECVATGRVIAVEHDPHPALSARKARNVATRGRHQ